MEQPQRDLPPKSALRTVDLAMDSSAVTNGGKKDASRARHRKDFWVAVALSIFAFAAFYFSTKATQQPFDYTFRIAGALLDAKLGLTTRPPSWLSEMVPTNGKFYSVFPLGAVLANVPLVLLRKTRLIHEFPAHGLAAALAGVCVYFFFRLSTIFPVSLPRRVLLALFPVFGTWTWCNLGFGGAWQIALGFALLGETAAVYFTLAKMRPLVAGAWFALAFGNRTELVLTLPVFIFLWMRRESDGKWFAFSALKRRVSQSWRPIALFLAIPFALALCTAGYNFARFGSVLDFGYARIPGVLKEPWYHGHLFAFSAIPWNMYKMLFEGFGDIPNFPYIRPHAFGCSIFLASPFLFLLFREGGKDKVTFWVAIGLLTFALWCHGNPGGWQFSYRYAITLLPWMFLLLLRNGSAKASVTEVLLFMVSVGINAIATYQFLWTNQIHP
jgi:hypothetical protein